jgi:hypothetical protein
VLCAAKMSSAPPRSWPFGFAIVVGPFEASTRSPVLRALAVDLEPSAPDHSLDPSPRANRAQAIDSEIAAQTMGRC